MPRNYQKTKNNPYYLPHYRYMMVMYVVRGYDAIKEEYHTIADYTPPLRMGMPCGSEKANPTEEKGIRLATLSDELHAIEQALLTIPKEYRQGIMQNIKYRTKYPAFAHYNTWQHNKQKFAHAVAKGLKYI